MKIIFNVKTNKTTKHAKVRALRHIRGTKYEEVGYMKLGFNFKTRLESDPDIKFVRIDWIYVDPEFRGLGIATGLYQTAAEFACSLGAVMRC